MNARNSDKDVGDGAVCYFTDDLAPVFLSVAATGEPPPRSVWSVLMEEGKRDSQTERTADRTEPKNKAPQPVYLLTPESFAIVWHGAKRLELKEIAGQYPTEKMREAAERIDVLRTLAWERFGDDAVRAAIVAAENPGDGNGKLSAPDTAGAVDFDAIDGLMLPSGLEEVRQYNLGAKVGRGAKVGEVRLAGGPGREKESENCVR